MLGPVGESGARGRFSQKGKAAADLDEVVSTTKEALSRVRSIGVAITPCEVPGAGKPSFTLKEDEMEIGMGIHGEAGIQRGPRRSADEVTVDMMKLLLEDLLHSAGDTVSVLVNSLGATPLEELYIIYRKAVSLYYKIRGRTALQVSEFPLFAAGVFVDHQLVIFRNTRRE